MLTAFETPRLRELQRALGVEPDGILGPVTLTALERATLPTFNVKPTAPPDGLLISRRALDQIIEHEIGSEAHYRRHLETPYWPKGQSGVTVGIGYDLGYQTSAQIAADFGAYLGPTEIRILQTASGLKGQAASSKLRASPTLRGVRIPLDVARRVFFTSLLPRYARLTRRAYPGIEELPADAQGALLSLVYNRGTSMSGAHRREMLAIRGHVEKRDRKAIARELRSMKRLWTGKGLPGLLKRRDDEAALVEGAARSYSPAELIRVS